MRTGPRWKSSDILRAASYPIATAPISPVALKKSFADGESGDPETLTKSRKIQVFVWDRLWHCSAACSRLCRPRSWPFFCTAPPPFLPNLWWSIRCRDGDTPVVTLSHLEVKLAAGCLYPGLPSLCARMPKNMPQYNLSTQQGPKNGLVWSVFQ